MNVRAMVLGAVEVRDVVAKQGKRAGETFTFRTLNIIDLDAPANMQKVLTLDVHENSTDEASVLAGKTANLRIYVSDGKQYFGGNQVQVVPAEVAAHG